MNRNSPVVCYLRDVVLGLLVLTLPASAAVLYVSPSGNDAADGKTALAAGGSGPVATVAMALKRLGAPDVPAASSTEPDRIVVMPGEYPLTEPIRIGPLQVRNPATGLVIEAQEPGTAVLSGGRVLAPVEVLGGQWLVKGVTGRVENVWVDGVRAVRARSPNGGKFYIGGHNSKKPMPEARFLAATLPDNIENTRSLILPGDAQAALRIAVKSGDASLSSIGFYAMHSWTSSVQEIKSFDADSGMLTLAPQSQWMYFQFSPNQRFAFDNHMAFLDEPGEWLLSSDGSFRYIPIATQKASAARVVASQLERLLEVTGSPDQPVKGLVLRGLRFAYSNAKRSPFIDSQAALSAPPAVLVEYAQNLEIDDCAFEHIGGYALALRRGVTQSVVRRSLFDDLGAGGIRIGAAAVATSAADKNAGNVVENNLIRRGGATFPGGIGIWVGQSGMNKIVHNEIHSLNYTAVSLGWTWGYGASDAYKNIVESNYIHDIGQGMLDDLGGIYVLGKTEGTLIKGNRIEDITSFSRTGATAWGIYLDAGSSNVTVEENVTLRTTGGGFHLHYGHDNIVRNNIFAYGLLAQVWRTAKGVDASLVFERNVLVGDTGKAYAGNWQDSSVRGAGNLLGGKSAYTSSAGPLTPDSANVSAAGKGAWQSRDPQLKCNKGNCMIDKDAAAAIGFHQFSTATVGILKRGKILAN